MLAAKIKGASGPVRRFARRAVLSLVALGSPAAAQVLSGNIYGHVRDDSGTAIAGATVQLKGANIGGLSTTSSAQGDFHFLALDPGSYTLSVAQKGFATTVQEVIVTTGINLEVAYDLRLTTADETVTVTAESPVVTTKKVGTGTTLTQDELARTPNARDPWALLRTIPGVLVETDNIAGSENDRQAMFVGKGADFADNTFTLDGTNITYNGGGSSAYFDFDSFQEISVSTGGSDLRAQTGGVNLNLTTRRGTNHVHGSARGYLSHDSLEWSNLPASLVDDPRLELPDGSFSDKADHIRQGADYGVEVGGPIVKDKLWIWGAFGHQDIRVVRLENGDQTPVETYLTNWNAKLNWQASEKDTLSFVYFRSTKEKFGINPGLSGQAANSFLLDQGDAYPNGPHGLYKLEESHVFNSNWFLNATYTYFGFGFGHTPKGGTSQDGGVDLLQDFGYGSSPWFKTTNPWHMADLDLRHFRAGLGGNHEIRFGFGYRRTPVSSISAYSGSKVFPYRDSPEGGFAQVRRDGVVAYTAQYWDAYLGDTYTRGRLTLNAGLRYDHQTARDLASSAAANPVFPELLPELDFPGGGPGIHWNDVSPRAAVTYALDAERRTVARASYAHYAGRISAADATYDSPIGLYGSYLAYQWVDLNHDGFAQRDEVLVGNGVMYAYGVDPANPTSPTSPKRIDSNYVARHDDEVIVGIERELLPAFALSAAYTWRRNTDRSWTPRIGLTTSDYTPNPPVTANGLTAQTFSPDPVKVAASGNGTILSNRPDYAQRYNGLELSLTKRLSHKWMARAGLAYMDFHENFLGPAGIQNPTHQLSDPLINGGQVAIIGRNSGVSSRWQVSADGLYELPHGLEVSAAFWARQGFLDAYFLNLPSGADGRRLALASPTIDDHRLPNVYDLDLRLAKTFKLPRGAGLVLSVDLFNVFNSGTVVGDNDIANSTTFGTIYAILNPRIARLGARLTF